jgi:hypothetical protein
MWMLPSNTLTQVAPDGGKDRTELASGRCANKAGVWVFMSIAHSARKQSASSGKPIPLKVGSRADCDKAGNITAVAAAAAIKHNDPGKGSLISLLGRLLFDSCAAAPTNELN